MTIDEIVTLIQAVSDNGLTSFVYTEGDQKLVLKKKNATPAPVMISQSAPAMMNPMVMPLAAPAPASMAAPAVATEAPVIGGGTEVSSDNVITSPLVGTFYSSGSPEAAAFVTVGDTVKKGQVLGIIEAMKLMNEIESEFDGVVEAILVNNEDVVEFGQPLFRIR